MRILSACILIAVGVSTGSTFAWMNPHMTLVELCAMLFGCSVWFCLGAYSAARIADKERFSPFAPSAPKGAVGVFCPELKSRWVGGFGNPNAAAAKMAKCVKEGRHVKMQFEAGDLWVVREIEKTPGKGFAE